MLYTKWLWKWTKRETGRSETVRSASRAFRTPTRWRVDESSFCETTPMWRHDILVTVLLHHKHSTKVWYIEHVEMWWFEMRFLTKKVTLPVDVRVRSVVKHERNVKSCTCNDGEYGHKRNFFEFEWWLWQHWLWRWRRIRIVQGSNVGHFTSSSHFERETLPQNEQYTVTEVKWFFL